MIMKLDGVNKDYKGRKSEEDFDGVNLLVRGERWGVQLDVTVTPLYCLSCKTQLSHMYFLGGSRYGYVGFVECDHCGAKINCVDSDNIVEFLRTYHEVGGDPSSEFKINYRELYRLENPIWSLVQDKTGFDIIHTHKDQEVVLAQVVEEICNRIDLDPSRLIGEIAGLDTLFKRMPKIVTRWLLLLQHLHIIPG